MKFIKNIITLGLTSCLSSQMLFASSTIGELFTETSFEVPQAISSYSDPNFFNSLYKSAQNKEFETIPKLGGMDAGGGKILIYPNPKNPQQLITKVLDVYEGELAGYQMNLGPGESLDEKIKFVLNRLYKVAPNRALSYAKWINSFLTEESTFYPDSILPATADIGLTVLPKKSELLQVIIQRNDTEADIPGFSRYLVDASVFANLETDSKVALIFHEVIYRELRALGQKDSLRARYLAYLILSNKMDQLTQEKFNKIISAIGSDCIEYPEYFARMDCISLPKNFAVQNVKYKQIQFKALVSIRKYISEASTELKVAFHPSVDLSSTLTEIYKQINGSINYKIIVDPIELNDRDELEYTLSFLDSQNSYVPVASRYLDTYKFITPTHEIIGNCIFFPFAGESTLSCNSGVRIKNLNDNKENIINSKNDRSLKYRLGTEITGPGLNE